MHSHLDVWFSRAEGQQTPRSFSLGPEPLPDLRLCLSSHHPAQLAPEKSLPCGILIAEHPLAWISARFLQMYLSLGLPPSLSLPGP